MAKKSKKGELITFPQAVELYGFTADYFQKLARRGRIRWVTGSGHTFDISDGALVFGVSYATVNRTVKSFECEM